MKPIPHESIMYTGFESDEPEFKTRDAEDVLLIIEIDETHPIEDGRGNKGWSVICEDGVGYDCFWSEKLNMFVYALE